MYIILGSHVTNQPLFVRPVERVLVEDVPAEGLALVLLHSQLVLLFHGDGGLVQTGVAIEVHRGIILAQAENVLVVLVELLGVPQKPLLDRNLLPVALGALAELLAEGAQALHHHVAFLCLGLVARCGDIRVARFGGRLGRKWSLIRRFGGVCGFSSLLVVLVLAVRRVLRDKVQDLARQSVGKVLLADGGCGVSSYRALLDDLARVNAAKLSVSVVVRLLLGLQGLHEVVHQLALRRYAGLLPGREAQEAASEHANLDPRNVLHIDRHVFDGTDEFHALDDAPEDMVLVVKRGRPAEGDEKLRSEAAGTHALHREQAGVRVAANVRHLAEVAAENTRAAIAVVVLKVAALEVAPGDDAVDAASLVGELALLAAHRPRDIAEAQ
ncbi:ImmA/IrrE family metallo-endopeptidase [Babesia caballi]|uniref:ImmA/IrrE family metallo-endopeptidase n=1 Tax=Babesia caballi TaxID=5871 RepID=A0AAV4M0J8_BABCB|nr:ImmA/IrrE family metallo-endopeptidase [Babesia caballi]